MNDSAASAGPPSRWLDIKPNPQPLTSGGGHVFDKRSVDAVNGALAAGRPLLVRGEPGIGKSQLARAAAAQLRWPFRRHVVDSRTEARDLLYSFDNIARLGKAQLLRALGEDGGSALTELDERHFTRPGVLWWAINYATAMKLEKRVWAEGDSPREHLREEQEDPPHGVVVLVDEIDKGDSSVPNGLLSVLGDGWFEAPGGVPVERATDQGRPLIIVTTNGERPLPDAFVRRCFVLEMKMPKSRDDFLKFVIPRGRAQVAGSFPEEAYEWAAVRVWEAREKVPSTSVCPPGLAEYVDLLRAMHGLAGLHPELGFSALGDRIGPYVLEKYPEDFFG